MAAPRLITGDLEAIEDAFLDHLRAAREVDALAPIDVIVGTVLLRPYLQRLVAVRNGGLLNIRFTTMGELGVRLGEHSLATSGRRPLPAIGERAYAAEIARGTNSYFAPVADTAGFADAARRLVRELRQEAIAPDTLTAQLPALAESEEKGASLADLYARYLDGRTTFYDADDALTHAEIERFDGTQLVLYGVWRLSALGRALVERIAARVPVNRVSSRLRKHGRPGARRAPGMAHQPRCRGASRHHPPSGDHARPIFRRSLFSVEEEAALQTKRRSSSRRPTR